MLDSGKRSTTSPSYTAVGAIPTASDDVIFEAASANCILNVAGTCLSFNASTYGTKTFALGTNNISVGAGVFTLGTGMTVTGTGTLIRTGTGNTLTSNGVIWTGNVQFNANLTHTWGDNWVIKGNLTSLSNLTINGSVTIRVGGNLIFPNLISLSTTYILDGVGNLDGIFSVGGITIDTLSTNVITLTTQLTFSTGIFRLTSGIVNVTAGHLFRPSLCTLDTDRTSTGGNKISFFNCTTFNSTTFTFQSNLTITNIFTNAANITTVGAFNIYVQGNFVHSGTISGAATIILDGTANATIGTGFIGLDLVINKSGVGVVTPSATMSWGAINKTLTVNSAVNFLTNSTTLTLANATPVTIVNTFGSPFFNITMPNIALNINGAAIRISNDLRLTGLGATFAGAFGWDCNNLICSTAGPYNITLQQLVTYRTRTGVAITGGTSVNRVTMRTSSIGTDAIWTLDFGATQSMIYVNGLDIDSSGGQTIWSFGVLTTDVNTSINWNPGVPLRTVVHTFVN